MGWIRFDNHIAIEDDGIIAHLEAIDVYTALEDEIEFNGKKYGKPDKELKLYISQFSKEASIETYSVESKIFVRVTVDNHLVDFINGYMLDQIVIDDEWHYIQNAEELNQLLDGLNIVNNDCITIADYLELLRRDYRYGYIKNNVSGETINIDVTYRKPHGLNAELYEYQKHGVAWLDYMLMSTHGCILGDEMGLGKTLQAISLILERKKAGEKCLVIAPVSLLDNWKNECTKFAPSLRVLIHHGTSRSGTPKVLESYDLIVTSYGLAVTDNLLLGMINWNLLILDEAQNIKNPHSLRTMSIKNIPACNRLAVTGTPFENHVTDIWSILDFAIPDFLGTEASFVKTISDDINGAKRLEPLLSSVMLRRLVGDVARDLPEKVIISQPISMTDTEAEQYELLRLHTDASNATLPMLQKLRMYCTFPSLTNDSIDGNPTEISLKYQRCCELLEEILSRGDKAIIFTSYHRMFDIFSQDLPIRFKAIVKTINGSTPISERQGIVDWFSTETKRAVLVLNPRAAGTGLNITCANHVIHYNLEWNPAVEDQASARAYRRGQKRTTFIYRLYYLGTVEEIINERLERKRDIAESAVVGVNGTSVDMQDIIEALRISPKKGC